MPGLALAVTDREKLLRVATFGYADLASERPILPGTMFEIGSIGKSFTNVALLQLRDEGRIDLQAPGVSLPDMVRSAVRLRAHHHPSP